jgi:signal transduction histidine kinase
VRGERSKEWQLSASVAPGGSSGTRRVIVVARDVTTLVGLESSLRRAEAMAQLGTLVSGVAHEVRNPLFAISATADALEARTAGREELGPFIEALRGEVARLNRLMGDLLEYGRPAALELEQAEVGDVVARTLRRLETLATERHVTIRNLVVPKLARVPIDPGRITQVLQNIVDNALRLSPDGAEIEVRGAALGTADVRRVEITVLDRGPGFAPSERHRVFEPFFTRRASGTGLGLAIVKRLVEDHGGAVEVRDRDGGGAEVGFWLPMSPGRAGEGPLPESPDVAHR